MKSILQNNSYCTWWIFSRQRKCISCRLQKKTQMSASTFYSAKLWYEKHDISVLKYFVDLSCCCLCPCIWQKARPSVSCVRFWTQPSVRSAAAWSFCAALQLSDCAALLRDCVWTVPLMATCWVLLMLFSVSGPPLQAGTCGESGYLYYLNT